MQPHRPDACRTSHPVALLLLALGCTPAADPTMLAEQLMDADRAFAAAVADGGSAAWVSWFAPDGAIIREGVGEIRGHDAVRDAVTFLDLPNVTLSWEPTRADVAESGDLGWSTGEFIFRATNDSGHIDETRGVYVSIWSRQPDGAWKVVMDLGNPVSQSVVQNPASN